MGVLVLAGLALAGYAPLINGGGWTYILAGVFGLGALMYYNRYAVPLSWTVAGLLALVAWLSSELPVFYYIVAIATAYTVLCIAYSRPLRLPVWIEDFSYGTYLYAFPIQQALSHAIPGIGPVALACIAIPLSLVTGAASWHFIEKPFLRLKGSSRAPVSIDATPQAHSIARDSDPMTTDSLTRN
jgi:peptidoglycan/LPS O-acetylase OafA/YrhL